ncbi:hypothetical protein N7320_02130 [Stutzerimonas stutzeri]|uniref:hypothetical protein n=1 Tax=Stutzerimonas stutzeri TaxID=316 RepID=UPI002449461F|nr:hypothetical protein [Stutzerimonas stutzeri]MDH0100112.1 hypothetical protein [Stutzerimonas stutzeri]
MELAELIAAVKAAATKDALESLVKAELSLDLDKRKSLKALRAEVLKGLGEDAEEGDDTRDDEEAPAAFEIAADAPAEIPAPEAAPITPPALEEAPEPEHKPAPGNRLLRNKSTGRTFIWTPALAALADLEEV